MRIVKVRWLIEALTLAVLVFAVFSQLANVYYLWIMVRAKDLPQVLAFAEHLNYNAPYLFRVIKIYLDSSYGIVNGIRAALIGISFFNWLILIYLITLVLVREVAAVYKDNLRQLSTLGLSTIGANLILLTGVAVIASATNFSIILNYLHILGYLGLVFFFVLLVLTNVILSLKLRRILERMKRKDRIELFPRK